MSMITYALSGSFKNFNRKLDPVAKKTGKSKIGLMFNFLHCFMMIGSGYSDFLNYELYNKSRKEIKEYASIKTQDKFYSIVSPDEHRTFFSIKSNFLKNFSKYIERESFYKGTFDEFKKFIKDNEKFMYKPVNGLGGGGVKSVNASEIEDLEEFYKEVNEKDILLEGYVKQHHEIAAFADKSVNTIRVMTFAYNGKSRIMCAIMRIGDGEADVDNFHKGGMGVLVDVETGKLVGEAINKNVEHFEYHPKSNLKFDGFQIPNWDIVKKTCLEAALVSDKIHCVGWDVAVTENGCTFIEGNRRPGWDLPQVLYRRGRKDLMNECLQEINEVEGTKYKV